MSPYLAMISGLYIPATFITKGMSFLSKSTKNHHFFCNHTFELWFYKIPISDAISSNVFSPGWSKMMEQILDKSRISSKEDLNSEIACDHVENAFTFL